MWPVSATCGAGGAPALLVLLSIVHRVTWPHGMSSASGLSRRIRYWGGWRQPRTGLLTTPKVRVPGEVSYGQCDPPSRYIRATTNWDSSISNPARAAAELQIRPLTQPRHIGVTAARPAPPLARLWGGC